MLCCWLTAVRDRTKPRWLGGWSFWEHDGERCARCSTWLVVDQGVHWTQAVTGNETCVRTMQSLEAIFEHLVMILGAAWAEAPLRIRW